MSPNELARILEVADDAARAGLSASLATVVSIAGSSYRRPGARLLVREDGAVAGGVSGGCLEADVIRRCRRAIVEERPAFLRYDGFEDAAEDGDRDEERGAEAHARALGCGGAIEVLVEPLSGARGAFHMEGLRLAASARTSSVLAISFGPGDPSPGAFARFTGLDGPALSGLARRVATAFQRRRSESVAVEPGRSVLLDYLEPAPRLLIVGAGPDAPPLAALADLLGYSVLVVDDRPGHLERRHFAAGVQVAASSDVRTLADAHTACIVASHDVKYDARALEQLLASPASYIGVLGPRRRTTRLCAGLRLRDGDRSRLHAPIGLDIGARTPEEIALAILAEIQASANARSGGFLRARQSAIHD